MGKRNELADERERLARFVVEVYRFILQRAPNSTDSLRTVQAIPWQRAPLAGIRMAARDVVEMCQDVQGEQLVRLDSELASAGLPTLSAMRNAAYPKVRAVLVRGIVRNEQEWHLLNGFVSDTADRVLSEAERQQAESLVHEYRQKG